MGSKSMKQGQQNESNLDKGPCAYSSIQQCMLILSSKHLKWGAKNTLKTGQGVAKG
jgi:hypothetical protein